MEDFFLANYLDPIARVWANAQPSYRATGQEKKGKSITCNKKKQKIDLAHRGAFKKEIQTKAF